MFRSSPGARGAPADVGWVAAAPCANLGGRVTTALCVLFLLVRGSIYLPSQGFDLSGPSFSRIGWLLFAF